jgi:Flp pilus assembly protein TadG
MTRRHSQRGSTMIEVAIAFLLFFTVLCAIMEFGRLVFAYNVLAGATREGARYAIVHGGSSGATATSDDIATVVRKWAIGLDSNSVTVTTTWTPSNAPGAKVKVAASYTVSPLTGMIFGGGIALGSNSQMVISQ